MTPSQVLERLELERDRIRSALTDARFATHAPQGCGELEGHATRLREMVAAYTDLEDELLPTVLWDVDPWGPVRVAELRRMHARRRGALEDAVETVAVAVEDLDQLRRLLTLLVDLVAREIDSESSHVVSGEVLRDDIAPIDSFCS